MQDSQVEVENHNTDENKPSFTTTTFIVSSSQTSPEYDMCVSVNINGGQTPHTVTVERKASRRCVCQVFYHKEEVNCWKITLAFFSEHLINVSIICLITAIMHVRRRLASSPPLFFAGNKANSTMNMTKVKSCHQYIFYCYHSMLCTLLNYNNLSFHCMQYGKDAAS